MDYTGKGVWGTFDIDPTTIENSRILADVGGAVLTLEDARSEALEAIAQQAQREEIA
jgi:hypothetical protein